MEDGARRWESTSRSCYNVTDDGRWTQYVFGDEPLVHPSMIEAALRPMRKDRSVVCVNLTAPILSKKELEDPNTIKVVMDQDGDALYMSRSAIPNSLHGSTKAAGLWKQVCIIPFRKSALIRYTKLRPTPLETAESIDMMRFIENKILTISNYN